jgi:hypothetical protein
VSNKEASMASKLRGARRLGDFLNDTFSLVPRLWRTILPVSLAAIAPGSALFALAIGSMGGWIRGLASDSASLEKNPALVFAGLGPFIWLYALAMLALFVGQTYLKAFVCLATGAAIDKAKPRLGELARQAFRPALIRLAVQDLAIGAIGQVLSLAAAAAILVPFIMGKLGAIVRLKDSSSPPASLIAGFIAAYLLAVLAAAAVVWWLKVKMAVAAPATVLEDRNAVSGAGRSIDLVRGRSWRIFGTVFIVSLIISFGLGILTGPFTFAAAIPGYFSFIKENISGAKPSMASIERLLTSLSWTMGLTILLNGIVEGTLMSAFLTLLHADLSEAEEKAGRQRRAQELMAPRRKRPAGIARRLSRELARRDEWDEGESESDSEGLF